MTRCCKHVVCSVHLCSNSKDRRSVCLDKLGLRRQLAPRRIKGKAIHIQTKCVVVFKSSQVLLVLIMWKAAGSNEKDGDPPPKKIYSWTNAKRKEGQKQGKRTTRSWWGTISCRPVFLRITALVHKYECTDENWWILPKRHPGFCAELFLDNVNAEFLKEVQRSAEKLVEQKWIWIKTDVLWGQYMEVSGHDNSLKAL